MSLSQKHLPEPLWAPMTMVSLVVVTESGSGKCFWLKDNTATGTRYATTTASPCAEPGTISGTAW